LQVVIREIGHFLHWFVGEVKLIRIGWARFVIGHQLVKRGDVLMGEKDADGFACGLLVIGKANVGHGG